MPKATSVMGIVAQLLRRLFGGQSSKKRCAISNVRKSLNSPLDGRLGISNATRPDRSGLYASGVGDHDKIEKVLKKILVGARSRGIAGGSPGQFDFLFNQPPR